MPLGGSCPFGIVAPQAPGASVQPDGSVPLSWPTVGTDVWYYVWFCDQTTHNCSAEGTASPWIAAFPTPNGPLWITQPAATITPAVAVGASGHTFAIYVHSFGAGNGSAGGNSPETSLQVNVQPPLAPTGLSVAPLTSTGGNTTYGLTWNQVTYPSTDVYYTVLYCDSTASTCNLSAPSTWTALTGQLTRTAQLTFPTAHRVGFCVRAENLGGTSPCSTGVVEGG
jgi:hypothetical protein